jgi:hypothetical protein
MLSLAVTKSGDAPETVLTLGPIDSRNRVLQAKTLINLESSTATSTNCR